jgi:hypothetical protein
VTGHFLRGKMVGMKLPRFSLIDLAWTVGLLALTAAGVGAFRRIAYSGLPAPALSSYAASFLMLTMPLWACAGLAAPFRRKSQGIVIGYLVFWVPWGAFMVAVLMSNTHSSPK